MQHSVMILAAAVLVTTASSVRAWPSNHALTEAEKISAATGLVIGAASACDNVTPERISSVTRKAAEVVASIASDEDELSSARDIFKENALAGQDEVASGNLDCERVNVAVSELERGI